MRLRTHFTITMLLFVITLAIITAGLIITHRMAGKVLQQERLASDIAQGANELGYLSNDYLIYRESQQLKRWQSRFASFSAKVADLRPDSPEQQALLANLQANQYRLKEVFQGVISALENAPRKQGAAFDPALLQVAWSRMAIQIQGLDSDASRLSQLLHQRLDRLNDTRTVLMYAMLGLFGIFLLASYLLTQRRILRAIAALQAGTAVIGSGNLDFVIEEKKEDEIGELSRAFNRMTTDLKAVTASRADLEREIVERERMEGELRRSRDELDLRVQERTSELARANQDLLEEIVKREKAEQQLRQRQKLEAIGTLTGGIAHDFNNLLATIIINSEMALLDTPVGSATRNNLDLILQSGIRGRDLVRQMLLFSRRYDKHQEVLPLTPLIKETFKLLRSSLPTTIQMKLHLETDSDTVYADASQLQQVIMNLCTNAAYAMRGKTGSIDIHLQRITFISNELPEPDMQPGDYLVLSVKDTGVGMNEEVRKRLFEPFFTTKPVGEGTGLGLPVVYGIVKGHKGNVTVHSEPGKGSIVNVYLPKVDPSVSAHAGAPKPVSGGNERILIVDDEEIIARSVRNMLERLGYKVIALMDSEEALKLFAETPFEFDLVMMDQTMPSMTGEDLGRQLMGIRPDIPIILCTGYSDLISSERALAMGFQGFIMKPFTFREGAEIVRGVLDRKRSK